MVDQLIGFMRSTNEPCFAWGHFMDVHAPYNRYSVTEFGDETDPRTIQRLFRRAKYLPFSITEEERQILIDAYDNSLRHLDHILLRLWEFLTFEDYWENTVVILTADHGEQFGEHGRYEHRRFLDTELLHVPLLIWDAHQRGGIYPWKRASVDIPATIADYAGLAPNPTMGLSLFDDVIRPVKASCIKRGRRWTRVV